jgi:O-antigen ligase
VSRETRRLTSAIPADPWKNFISCGLALVLFLGVLTVFVPGRLPAAGQEGLLFALAILWAARHLLFSTPLIGSWLLIPLALAVLSGPLQLVLRWTVYPYVTIVSTMEWIACFLGCFLAIQTLETHRSQRYFRLTLVYFGLALSALAIVQYFSSNGKILWIVPTGYGFRTLGPFVNRDHYSVLIELLLPMAIYMFWTNGKRLRDAAIAGVMIASVIAGCSRAGAILSVSAAIMTSVLTFLRRRRAARPSIRNVILLVSVVILAVVVVGWQDLMIRFLCPDQFAVRRDLNVSSLRMIRANPWTGWGLGTWTYIYPAYATFSPSGFFVNAAHNDWAQWTVEGGLGFLLAMLAIFGWSIVKAYELPWALGIPAVLIHCFVEFPMQVLPLSLWVFVTAGLVAVARRGSSSGSRDLRRRAGDSSSRERESLI